jgi:serine/threonine-protein kinase
MGTRGLTRTGTQMGTVAYMSPEQIRNGSADIRSDIYELGVTLYEMVSGHLPFESDSDFQVMQDHVATPPPPPSRFYPYLSKGLENVILKSLEKNPDARFQTVEEFGAALEHPESFASATPPAKHGTVLETPPFAKTLADKTQVAPAATVATLSVPPSSSGKIATQPITTQPRPSGPQTKWILAGVGVLLAALIAVGAYRTLTPVNNVGPSASSSSSIKNVLSEQTPTLPPTVSSTPQAAQPTGGVSPVLKLSPTPQVSAPRPHALSGDEMLQHAQTALAQQRYFEPFDNSALYWTIRARKAGNPSASALESEIQGVYKQQMLAYYQQRNYPAALALLNGMLRYYPDNPSLLAERGRIQSVMNTRR